MTKFPYLYACYNCQPMFVFNLDFCWRTETLDIVNVFGHECKGIIYFNQWEVSYIWIIFQSPQQFEKSQHCVKHKLSMVLVYCTMIVVCIKSIGFHINSIAVTVFLCAAQLEMFVNANKKGILMRHRYGPVYILNTKIKTENKHIDDLAPI